MDTMDIAGYNYPDRYFKDYAKEHAAYPNRILLGTENYQNLENWIMVRDNPYVAGLFLWVGIDYLGEALQWPRLLGMGTNRYCRFRKEFVLLLAGVLVGKANGAYCRQSERER